MERVKAHNQSSLLILPDLTKAGNTYNLPKLKHINGWVLTAMSNDKTSVQDLNDPPSDLMADVPINIFEDRISEEYGPKDQSLPAPKAEHAERAVIGAFLLSPTYLDLAEGRITQNDFENRDYRAVMVAIEDCVRQEVTPDIVHVNEILAGKGNLDALGGTRFIDSLVKSVTNPENIASHIERLKDASLRRQAIDLGREITVWGHDFQQHTGRSLIETAQQRLFDLSGQGVRGQGFVNINEGLVKAINHIEVAFNSGGALQGLPTGYTDLDELTSGLAGGDLIIVAGRPSMGKTTFAMNVAEHQLERAKQGDGKDVPIVAVFSMEMPTEQLTMRTLASWARIDMSRLKRGAIEDDEWPSLAAAMGRLKDTGLNVDDTPALSVAEVRARARKLAREKGRLDLIIVDYLQLMSEPSSSHNRTEEISTISRGLKSIAKELGVPVIALSQLNRSLEQRSNKRPVMADLRESGAIEQDADLILFVYRDEVYNEESPDRGIAEIIIGKQRNGPIGTVRLNFIGKYTRFENFMPQGKGGYDGDFGYSYTPDQCDNQPTSEGGSDVDLC